MVSTFKTLCGLADFAGTKVQTKDIGAPEVHKETEEEKYVRGIVELEPKIQVNIGINIAADTPDDKIKVIFENMKKYLLTRDKE